MRRTLLLAAHAALALLIIGLLFRQYEERRAQVAETRRAAEADREVTERLARETQVQQDLLRGIKDGDPYVVEMLAREKLRYQRQGEIAPPPRPAVDSPSATHTK